MLLVTAFVCITSLSADDQGGKIRVVFNKNLRPFQFIGNDENPQGMHVEILRQTIRFKPGQLEFIPCDDDITAFEILQARDAELLLGHRTGPAVLGYQSTSEISSASLCVITSEEIKRLMGDGDDYGARSAAFEFGTMNHTYLYNLGLKNYYVHSNQKAVVDALLSRDVDFAVGIKESLVSFIDLAGLESQYTVLYDNLAPISYSILALSENIELIKALDLGLAELRARGDYAKIYNRWIINRDLLEAENAKKAILRLIQVVLALVLVAGLIIGINTRANRILKERVDEKTKELRQANIELESRMDQLESESHLRESIIENSPRATVIFDESNHITFLNAAAVKLSISLSSKDTSLSSDDFLSRDILVIYPFGEIITALERDRIYSIETHEPSIVDIERLGKTFSFRCNLYRKDEFRSIQGRLLTVEDVTKEERKKQALFESEKNKILNRLVAGIAHEIKNPLMTIRTAVSLIQTEGDDPEVKNAFMNFVPAEIERINKLIENLIHYARPAVASAEEFSLSTLLKDCLYLAHLAGKRTHIRFKADIQDGMKLFGNKYQLKQALINLIMNGIESLEKKHENGFGSKTLAMSFTAIEFDDHLIVKIHDTGVGMKPEELRLCKNPFFTTKATGTGLGLSIANQFISENGGKMTIDSVEQVYTEITILFRRPKPREA